MRRCVHTHDVMQTCTCSEVLRRCACTAMCLQLDTTQQAHKHLHACTITLRRKAHQTRLLMCVHKCMHVQVQYVGTTTGRPHTITACRCGLNAAGAVRPSRKAASSSAGVEGWPLARTPCERWPLYVPVEGGGCSRAVGSLLEPLPPAGAPAASSAPAAESASPCLTLSSRPAAAAVHRGSGAPPLGIQAFLPMAWACCRVCNVICARGGT